MTKRKTKLSSDAVFIVWICLLIAVIVTVSVVSYKNGSYEKDAVVTPTPTAKPSEAPSLSDEGGEIKEVWNYSIPRLANVSLNPNIKWETTIGGSGSDVLCGVITLKESFLFGNTSSKDFDFTASSSQDLFVAKMTSSGSLDKTVTFGSRYEDVALFAKPYSKGEGEGGVVVVAKNTTELDLLYFYKVTTALNQVSNTTLKFKGNVSVSMVISSSYGLYVFGNETLDSQSIPFCAYVDYDFEDSIVRKLSEVTNGKTVAGFNVGKKNVAVLNSSDGKSVSICNFSMDAKEGAVVTKLSFNGERTCVSFLPKEGGGFIMTAKYVENGLTKYSFTLLDGEYNIIFEHTVKGDSYSGVTVIPDFKMNVLNGYHIFAYKETATKCRNVYEYVCAHGDLTQEEESVLEGHKIEYYFRRGSGIVFLTKSFNNGHSDVGIVICDRYNNFKEYKFGGEGNDVGVFAIVNPNSRLVVYGVTTSSSGDVLQNFGKSDVWVFSLEDVIS